MRLATWNVNSIRARVDRIVDFAVRESVDVLAMQEIKCSDAQFPRERFEDAGYHVEAHGFSQWNGVAIASREPLTEVAYAFPGMPGFAKDPTGEEAPQEARAIGATVGGVRIWSLYVPNGRALEDPHYFYKLEWLSALRQYATDALTRTPDLALALVGDFNAYTFEDPMRELYGAGYVKATKQSDYSYDFDGQAGSLDHVLLNPTAAKRKTGGGVWNINSIEPTAREYSAYKMTAVDYFVGRL